MAPIDNRNQQLDPHDLNSLIFNSENVLENVICKVWPFYLGLNMLNFTSSVLMVVSEELTDPVNMPVGHQAVASNCLLDWP